MKLSDLKRVNKLTKDRYILQCLLDADRFEYIRAIAYDGKHSYDLPNDPRLKRAIDEAIASYMYELKCDLAQLGVEVDE